MTCLWDCKNVSEQKVQPNDTQGRKKNIDQVIIIKGRVQKIIIKGRVQKKKLMD